MYTLIFFSTNRQSAFIESGRLLCWCEAVEQKLIEVSYLTYLSKVYYVMQQTLDQNNNEYKKLERVQCIFLPNIKTGELLLQQPPAIWKDLNLNIIFSV